MRQKAAMYNKRPKMYNKRQKKKIHTYSLFNKNDIFVICIISSRKLKSIKRRKIFPTAFYTMIYIILPVTGTDTFLL